VKKKILIIGSNSFIAKNFIKKKNRKYNFFKVSKKNKVNTDLAIDLTKNKKKLLYKTFLKKKFFAVIDLAWHGVLGKDRNNKSQILNLTITKNIKFLLNIISFKKLISFGSQAEYGVQNKLLSENDNLKPQTLYAKIKCKKFRLFKNYFKNKKEKFIWFRLFSCYGKYCDKNWLIMYIIDCIKKGKVPKLTEGNQRRSFIHVNDICDAIDIAIENRKMNGVFNLANDRLYSIKEVYHAISQKLKFNKKIKFGKKKNRNDQPTYLHANLRKLKKYRWFPKIKLEKGILLSIR
jgi:nucleoside-diphosphate-sugar epimerase